VLWIVASGRFFCRPLCLFTVAFMEKMIEKSLIPGDLLGVILVRCYLM